MLGDLGATLIVLAVTQVVTDRCDVVREGRAMSWAVS